MTRSIVVSWQYGHLDPLDTLEPMLEALLPAWLWSRERDLGNKEQEQDKNKIKDNKNEKKNLSPDADSSTNTKKILLVCKIC